MFNKITRAYVGIVIIILLTGFTKTGANSFTMYKPGIYYREVTEDNMTYHIVKISLYKEHVDLHVIVSPETRVDNGTLKYKYEPLQALVEKNGMDLAVNAGFFNPTETYGSFEETVVVDAKVHNFRSDRAVLAWKGKEAKIGVWNKFDNLPFKEYAIGGGPIFVKDGVFNFDPYNEAFSDAVKNERLFGVNARTAIGLDKRGKELVIMVVDGNDEYNIGMNASQMAEIMIDDYDVYNAMMLDGGGSSSLIMGDDLINNPNLEKFQRNILSGLGVVSEEIGE